MHPDVVEFFMRKGMRKFSFWQFCSDDKITAAYFTVDDKDLGLNVWREYPISFDEVMLPISLEKNFVSRIRQTVYLRATVEAFLILYFFTEQSVRFAMLKLPFLTKLSKSETGN